MILLPCIIKYNDYYTITVYTCMYYSMTIDYDTTMILVMLFEWIAFNLGSLCLQREIRIPSYSSDVISFRGITLSPGAVCAGLAGVEKWIDSD